MFPPESAHSLEEWADEASCLQWSLLFLWSQAGHRGSVLKQEAPVCAWVSVWNGVTRHCCGWCSVQASTERVTTPVRNPTRAYYRKGAAQVGWGLLHQGGHAWGGAPHLGWLTQDLREGAWFSQGKQLHSSQKLVLNYFTLSLSFW